MEKLYSTGVANKLSSCDLDKEKLESLVEVATVSNTLFIYLYSFDFIVDRNCTH